VILWGFDVDDGGNGPFDIGHPVSDRLMAVVPDRILLYEEKWENGPAD